MKNITKKFLVFILLFALWVPTFNTFYVNADPDETEVPGGENPGGENPGGESPGGENPEPGDGGEPGDGDGDGDGDGSSDGGGSSGGNSGGGSSGNSGSSGGSSGSSGGGSSSSGGSSNNYYDDSYYDNSYYDTTPTYVDSSINTLSSILINGKAIEGFDEDKLEYTIKLPSDTTSVKVAAELADSLASLKGTGTFVVTVGEYEYEIVVTAEDGTTKTYKLKVVIDNKPTLFVNFGDLKLGFEVAFEGLIIPDGFYGTTAKYQDKEVKAWKHENEKKDTTLVYLSDEDENKSFYVYNQEGESIQSIYKQLTIGENRFVFLGISDTIKSRAGYTYSDELEVAGETISGWTFNSKANSNYYLLHLTNELDEADYFVYNTKDGKITTLSAFEIEQDKDKSSISLAFIIAVVVIGLISCAFIYSIFFVHKKRNYRIKKMLKEVDNDAFEELPITFIDKER